MAADRKILNNFSWNFLDKLLRGAGSVLVNIYLGRKLGVDNFGVLNYCLALFSFFQVFSIFGMDAIAIKKLTHSSKETSQKIITEALRLRFLTGFTAATLLASYGYFFEHGPEQLGILILSGGLVFFFLDVFKLYFESMMISKFNVLPEAIVFFIFLVVKIWLVQSGASLERFFFAIVGEQILGKVIVAAVFLTYRSGHVDLGMKDKAIFRSLVFESLPLMLASFSVILYMRLDQIMIGKMIGITGLGLYSAAVKLSEAWYFIPVTINMALYPYFVRLHVADSGRFEAKFQKFYDLMVLISLGAILGAFISSDYVIALLFGTTYAEASEVLVAHIVCGIFVSLGVASNSWLNIMGRSDLVLYRTVLGVLLNLILNWALIPKYGIIGGAISTIISNGLSVFSILISKNARLCGVQMLRSFNLLSSSKRLLRWQDEL